MRQVLLTAAAAFVAGGITAGAVLSQAQPTPTPNASPAPNAALHEGSMPDGTEHHGMMGWRHGHDRPINPPDLALIYRQPDRQLTAADVQKIAEGFLLWHGNHSWKVTNVAATPDGPIGFSLATPEDSVVAKFTMDTHTGKIARVG